MKSEYPLYEATLRCDDRPLDLRDQIIAGRKYLNW
jgi:hypothetical protein